LDAADYMTFSVGFCRTTLRLPTRLRKHPSFRPGMPLPAYYSAKNRPTSSAAIFWASPHRPPLRRYRSRHGACTASGGFNEHLVDGSHSSTRTTPLRIQNTVTTAPATRYRRRAPDAPAPAQAYAVALPENLPPATTTHHAYALPLPHYAPRACDPLYARHALRPVPVAACSKPTLIAARCAYLQNTQTTRKNLPPVARHGDVCRKYRHRRCCGGTHSSITRTYLSGGQLTTPSIPPATHAMPAPAGRRTNSCTRRRALGAILPTPFFFVTAATTCV